MAIKLDCPCGGRFYTRDRFAGKRARCPNCGEILRIPLADESSSEPSGVSPANVWSSSPVANDREPRRADFSVGTVADGSPRRERLYWALLVFLIPLAFSLLGGRSEDFRRRLERALNKASPEVQERVQGVVERLEKGEATRADLIRAFPDGKIDADAHLALDSSAQWLYALIAAVSFLALIAFFFPDEPTPPIHLVFVGLFTGTIGIVFLLAVQFAAAWTQSIWVRRGNALILLIFFVVKFIGWSYSSALDPDSNFFFSAIGFTFGVGLCEELCKALPILAYYHEHRNGSAMGWRGACLWGLASGVGFGISEGVEYSGQMYNGVSGWEIYVVRFVSCVALHAIWCGATAIAIERGRDRLSEAEDWRTRALFVLSVIAVPMVLHGLYDTLLKKDYEIVALWVGLLSFGWFAYRIERAKREDED